MTARRAGWEELFFAALLAAGVVSVGLPPVGPALLRLPAAPAVALGAAAGGLLFRALAGPRVPTLRLAPLAGRRGAVLAARAAVEEVAWRGFLLGALAAPLGPLAALGVTSAAFAWAHGGIRGRMRLVHVLTGGVFGGLYLSSGRLASAVAAHVVYNGLVVAACRPPDSS
ncbi:MAG TPA: CPBP family intramembrane glutamic endopeptidase [Gaiellaceae bacterium]|nr:CPBP family intramembrane glutamic endopeptidase [Gaiellaceae bacterium]